MPISHLKLPLLIDVFNDPKLIGSLSELQWDLLIRQARAANLLARLGWFLQERGENESIPSFARRHFESEKFIAQAVLCSTRWEVQQIYKALEPLKIKTLIVKGAAYSLMGLTAAQGRLYQDTDILVPKDKLPDIERMLMWHGWIDRIGDEYEQKYYRKWMHELPPKYHNRRGTVLDVHHNILPKTCRLCPDPSLILQNAIKVAETDYWTPAHEDLVIHSATHLFHEGEFDKGLRDISDINLLLIEFSQDERFWQSLSDRAEELKLGRPLFYALRYVSVFFNTPVPALTSQDVSKHSPNYLLIRLMDFLFMHALMPNHPSCDDRWTGLARWLLYIRSHWLRMPPHLLIPHLLRKTWVRIKGKDTH